MFVCLSVSVYFWLSICLSVYLSVLWFSPVFYDSLYEVVRWSVRRSLHPFSHDEKKVLFFRLKSTNDVTMNDTTSNDEVVGSHLIFPLTFPFLSHLLSMLIPPSLLRQIFLHFLNTPPHQSHSLFLRLFCSLFFIWRCFRLDGLSPFIFIFSSDFHAH